MSNDPPKPPPDSKGDDHYLRIWEVEQGHERHRWTITTFFIGLSFGAAALAWVSFAG
jgi:hypothetical protein